MISRERMRQIYNEGEGENIKKYLIIAAVAIVAVVILFLATMGGEPPNVGTTTTVTTSTLGGLDINQEDRKIESKIDDTIEDIDTIIEQVS